MLRKYILLSLATAGSLFLALPVRADSTTHCDSAMCVTVQPVSEHEVKLSIFRVYDGSAEDDSFMNIAHVDSQQTFPPGVTTWFDQVVTVAQKGYSHRIGNLHASCGVMVNGNHYCFDWAYLSSP